MPTARLCSLADVSAKLPEDCWIAEHLAQDAEALANEVVLHITGDVRLPQLHLDTPLENASPLRTWLQIHGPQELNGAPIPRVPFLVLIDGDLKIDGALTCDDTDGTTHLIVTGDAHMHNAVIGGQLVCVQGALRVDDLLWGDYNHGELRVLGGLQARVALFTDEYHLHINGPEQVEFLMDEVRGLPHWAEFSSEIAGAIFPPEFHDSANAGGDGLSSMLDRSRVVTVVRAGGSAVRSSADIHAAQPMAHELCADNTISIENILAVVHTPVIAHKEHKAYGWFQQTDFSLCQRHVDEDGDQRDDNVFITVWKTWDFYLSVAQVPTPQGLLQRLVSTVLRRAVPTDPHLTLVYRSYTDGEPGEWQTLSPDDNAAAWKVCQRAWRGVLDYTRKAVGQHRAHYPLYRRLQAELTARRIESFTTLPVFTEQYNDWWDSDRNGYWEGEVWVGARQPCMHEGEPLSRLLKLSWENGDEAPGDEEDNAHSAYQISVDEAREGPPVVEFNYSQRQNESRSPLPHCAADHIARLLRVYGQVEARIRAKHAQEQALQAEALRLKETVQLLTPPPLAADLPDAAVFPVELMTLSDQWQADGQRYVAAIRAHQRTMDAGADADTETPEESDDEDLDDKLPGDPRKAAAPTVMQLARVVSAWADEDLAKRFRQRFAFAPDAYVQSAAKAGRFIGPLFALDDGRVIAQIGTVYDDGAHWVALQGPNQTALAQLKGLGRSPDRRCFAKSDGQRITTHQGFDGPVIAHFVLPQGNEALPPHVQVVAGPMGQLCETLIPFNGGQRVLLANATGVYLLNTSGGVQRIHPQTFDEDGPYTWPKNQADEATGAALALDMVHVALSPNERHIAVGDQDSVHILLDAEGQFVHSYEPLSSYPHHATFSHDSALLFANSCHFYGGSTLSAPMNLAVRNSPSEDDAQAEEMPALNTQWRVYASATLPGQVILGNADGYLHAVDDTGRPLWRHHIGSTISAIDVSPDGSSLWVASYGGYLVQLQRVEAGMDPYSIGTSPYAETHRWIFWKDEADPVRW